MPPTKTAKPPSKQAALEVAAARFGMLSVALRVRIFILLAKKRRRVMDLCELTGAKQASVSNHLRRMGRVKALNSERDGKTTWYSLTATGERIAEAAKAMVGEK